MNQLKRNVLLGLGLCAIGVAGPAGAQQPADRGAQAATPAAASPKTAQPAVKKMPREASGAPANAGAPRKPSAGPMGAGPGRPEARGAPAHAQGSPKAKGPHGGPPGELRKLRPPRPSAAAIKAERAGAGEVRKSVRGYYESQMWRMRSGEESKKEIKSARRRERGAAKRALKQYRRASAERLLRAPKLTPEEKNAIKERLDAAAKKRAEDREARAEAKRKDLQKAYGKKLEKPAVEAELRHHAWRVARLQRLMDMATALDRPELAEKATHLLEKESEMHEVRLKAFSEDKMPDLPPAFVDKAQKTKKADKADAKSTSKPKPSPKKPSPGPAAPAAKDGAQ